ncbi:RPII140-upstream gene protein [Vespa crabro]|uniref:RPII140-upstream gene protein n=1 Tax=Vespa crabro TaxID=7445 RepID=UPI001F017F6A|nr:RPII140-upstream gene protein [Vespa crabro]XP_046820807.1 RPII140-upstream gene protein [Vespa crabro]XP_046820815.1 RPII140-upstream gene protein [Vespa crabro]XP_046820826.1 RPII140-upstream gene protein [Vespa crabro]
MLNITKIRRPLIMAIFPLRDLLRKYDVPKNPIVNQIEDTPMGRIKKIFISTEYEPISKELQSLINFTSTAALVGIVVGGVIYTQGALQKFIDNNEATRFYSQIDAQRALQTNITLQFAKGAYMFSWRLTLFCGIYEFIRMILTAYYGKSSILHYMIGAGIAGFLFKLSFGLKGSLIGLVTGTVLGGIGGSIILLFIKLTGTTLEDFQHIQSYWSYKRNEAYKQIIGKYLEEESEETKLLHKQNKDMQIELSRMEKETNN